jgi:hypothetical protein
MLWGFRGRVTAPGPDFSGCWFSRPARASTGHGSLGSGSGGWFYCDAHWGVVGRDGETAPGDVSGRPSTLKTSR